VDTSIFSTPLPSAPSTSEQATYVTPAVVYEATLEVRAGTCPHQPDPLNLFGLPEN
jgi:hypothetical protein